MRLLATATGSYLTGDAIADAVLEYWNELANDHKTAVVDIPFLDPARQLAHVQLAIGWGLPIASVTATMAPATAAENPALEDPALEDAELEVAALEDPALVESLLLRAHPRGSYADTPFLDSDMRQDDNSWSVF